MDLKLIPKISEDELHRRAKIFIPCVMVETIRDRTTQEPAYCFVYMGPHHIERDRKDDEQRGHRGRDTHATRIRF